MSSQAMVQIALEALSCNQKELALRLGVSTSQISKWKNGEYMSSDMRDKFREFMGIGNKDPDFVLLAGSSEDAEKWEKLIRYLAVLAAEEGEGIYSSADTLIDNQEILCGTVFDILHQMGVEIPEHFPRELDIEGDYMDADEETLEIINENPFALFIAQLFESFTRVNDFYKAYLFDLIFIEEVGIHDDDSVGFEIDSQLMHLAATKVEVDESFAPQFTKFKQAVWGDYRDWINTIKQRVFEAGKPLKAELMDIVNGTDYELADHAQLERLEPFKKLRVHPDVYMNELLIGMRLIHQVLPAIMKKLEIYDDFKLNEKEMGIF